jgi:hypothetical protein
MKTKTMLRISGILLLAAAILLTILALSYALQNPNLSLVLATVSWNGAISY